VNAATGPAASWYAASVGDDARRPALDGDVRADVAILGAGYTGLSAAIDLAQAGLSVVVLEAERVGWGASGRNGGQVIFGFSCGEEKLEKLVGHGAAKELFDWSVEGVRLLHERRERFDIDCDWRDGHAHVALHARHERELRAWQEALATRYGYALEWWDRERLRGVLASPRYVGGVYDGASGHLHPLKYVRGLARAAESLGVRIFEGTKVESLQRGARPVLCTARGNASADFAVLAGNAIVRKVAPELDRYVMPVGTYIAATAPLGAERMAQLVGNGMAAADINWALDYFRPSADHRLLFGGRASYSTFAPPNLAWVMRRRMQRVFPQLEGVPFDYLWGGLIDISLNRAPHFGRLGNNVFFAQGFSGHGVAATGLAGRVIAEAIRGQAQRLDAFARIPHRPFPGGRALRMPLLVAAMAWYKLRDAIG
jgi:gamma-glutamylputrescine oxidase